MHIGYAYIKIRYAYIKCNNVNQYLMLKDNDAEHSQ